MTASRLSPWVKGDPLSARRLNDIQTAVARAGVVARQIERGALGIAIQEAAITGVFADHLTCTYPGATGDLIVAMPWDLRQSSWDTLTIEGVSYATEAGTGNEIRRTADNGTDPAEHQIITPDYYVGARVLIAYLAPSTVQINIGTTASPEMRLAQYVDMNASARAWAKTEAPA